jgi:hypothetical protein
MNRRRAAWLVGITAVLWLLPVVLVLVAWIPGVPDEIGESFVIAFLMYPSLLFFWAGVGPLVADAGHVPLLTPLGVAVLYVLPAAVLGIISWRLALGVRR